MSAYDLVVFVHVLAAVVLVGGGILATPAVDAAIRRATTVSELRRWLTAARPLGLINPISSIALLGSGIYLASLGDWWSAPWVQIAVVFWMVNAVLANVVVNPSHRRVAQLTSAAEGDEIGPELDEVRRSPRPRAASDLMLASDLGILFLMVMKPSGYPSAALVLIVAYVGLVGSRVVWRSMLHRGAGQPATPAHG
jgi:uncharacterized membrane protein